MTAARPLPPTADNDYHAAHVDLLLSSYTRHTGRQLYGETLTGAARAQAVLEADFALLSHGTESDPLFNYGNRTALRLFELDWDSFVVTPSRESAEPAAQETRERFMRAVAQNGYADDYTGVRISARGRRFTIDQATVWNVVDDSGVRIGQAATFAHWTRLAD